MRIVSLNVGGVLKPDLCKVISFSKRKYIDNLSNSKSHKELTIRLASQLNGIENEFIGLEVKYPFGKRNKRIEVVSIRENIITLFKISKTEKFDKDILEMESLINNLKINSDYTINGIVLLNQEADANMIDSFLGRINVNIKVKNFKTFLENVLLS